MSQRLIRFDWAMKRLLRSKAQFGILEGFLSALLGETIKIKDILETKGNPKDKYGTSNQLDLLAENGQQEPFIIKLQNSRSPDFVSQTLFDTSKIAKDSLEQRAPYSKVTKVISVSIVYFDFGQGDDYIYVGKTQFMGWRTQKEQTLYNGAQTASQIYPTYYIIRLNQFNKVIKNHLDEWIYFLKTAKIEPTFSAPGLKEATEALELSKLSDAEKALYENYLEEVRSEESTM